MSTIKTFAVCVVYMAVAFAVYCVVGSWQCSARWEHSGLRSTWAPVQGCLVQVGPNRWLPDDRVREIDIPRPDAKPSHAPLT